jgi:hypothetical protein
MPGACHWRLFLHSKRITPTNDVARDDHREMQTPAARCDWNSLAALVVFGAAWVVMASGCGSERSGATAGSATGASSTSTGEISPADSPAKQRPKLAPGAKTAVLERAGDRPYDKTFDDIRFEIEPGDPFHREMLPEAIEAMAGQRIRIRGFILPTAQKRGFRAFVLVRDNQECCFGPGAALYDCILVEMQAGKTAEFSIRPVAVEGTFGIREVLGPDGKHLAIYHLEGESVR